ncbi:MAG TPA: T9SS type A sorting domain-containing protein [Chitinophagales bacterium]|nr:T9SS type A sorting domain-containing protein [Chitinophagales bacterium]
MARAILFLALMTVLQCTDGVCGFTLEAPGFGVKRIVASDNGVLATDGMSMLLLNAQGEKLDYRKLDFDNSYLLQDAVQSNGVYYFLYQHSGSTVRFALLALNADLSVRWLRDYEQAGATFGYALAAAPDGVLVAGRSCDPGFFLCNVSANGSVAWHKTYASGNATALPGALVATPNGFAAAFQVNNGAVWHLGILNVDYNGNALHTTLTPLSNMYIKSLVQTDEGYAAMVHRPAGGINSIVTFDPSFNALTRFDVVSSNPLQLNSIQFSNGSFVVCGNALQSGGSNLDAIYGTLDATSLATNFMLTGTSAYDDARCVVKQNHQIWFGGNRASNAFVGSFAHASTQPCMFLNITATVSQLIATSDVANADVSIGPSFIGSPLMCGSSPEPISIVNVCTVFENPTSVQSQPAAGNLESAVYPNPCRGAFTVECKTAIDRTISVYDIYGKRVHQQRLQSNVSAVNLKHPMAGSYVLEIINHQSALVETRRMVVMP